MKTIGELLGGKKIDPKEAALFLSLILKKDRAFLITHGDKTVSDVQSKKFTSWVKRRSLGEPVAYILGFQTFLGRDFKVDRRVLIPRPETEELTKKVIEWIKERRAQGKKIFFCDIGTGSGCIAASVGLAFPDIKVFASDVSPATLSVVKYNCKNLSTVNVSIIKDDLFGNKVQMALIKHGVRSTEHEVVIVANLPYLPRSDARGMQKDVIKFEPKLALFAKDDGMYLIKKLLHQIKEFEKPTSDVGRLTSAIFLEIDPRQATPLPRYANKLFPNKKSTIAKDLHGRKRFLIIN